MHFINVADKTVKGVKFFLVQPNTDMDLRFKGFELVEIVDHRRGKRIRQKTELNELTGPRGLYHIAYIRSLDALKSYIKDNGAYQREMYDRYRKAYEKPKKKKAERPRVQTPTPTLLKEGEYAGMIRTTEIYRAPTLAMARRKAVSNIPLNSNINIDIWVGTATGDEYVGSVRMSGNNYIYWSPTAVRVLDYNGNLR